MNKNFGISVLIIYLHIKIVYIIQRKLCLVKYFHLHSVRIIVVWILNFCTLISLIYIYFQLQSEVNTNLVYNCPSPLVYYCHVIFFLNFDIFRRLSFYRIPIYIFFFLHFISYHSIGLASATTFIFTPQKNLHNLIVLKAKPY